MKNEIKNFLKKIFKKKVNGEIDLQDIKIKPWSDLYKNDEDFKFSEEMLKLKPKNLMKFDELSEDFINEYSKKIDIVEDSKKVK